MKRLIPSVAVLIVLSWAPGAQAEPVLLLFHAGGFVAGDPSFEDDAATYAQAQGFQAVNVDYPLCDVPSAMDYALDAAATAGGDGTPVFAYGDSSGAILALRLAEEGSVRAGAGYSPLLHFADFIAAHPSASSFDCIRGESAVELDSVSPALYSSQAPALDVSGTDDCLAPNQDAVTWASADPLVWTWQVSGGHLGGGTCLGGEGGPGYTAYETSMQGAIDWLTRQSQRDSAISISTHATASATLGQSISDQAILVGGVNPTGTIAFKAWGPADDNCAEPPVFTDTVSVSNNGDYQSSDFTPPSTGTYRWTADYSGDSSNGPASSPCNDANETSTVARANPTLTTQALDPTPTSCTVPVSGLVNHGASSQPWVSVTFDDHLSPANTQPIIGAFDRFDMEGTFFTIGKEARDLPALTQEILDHGNELGNHAWSQADLTQTSDKGLYQYWLSNQTIHTETGFRPCLARPPHGHLDAGVIASADTLGMTTVKWGHSPCWCDTNPEHIAAVALDDVQPGQIILLHQTDADTQALPMILQGLADRGLRSVSTTVLLGGHLDGANLGRPIHDSASLVSGYSPTGTITFRAYGPNDDDCSNSSVFQSNPVTVSGNDVYDSPDFTPVHAGAYRWTVDYSGDGNNDPAVSICGTGGTSTVPKAVATLATLATSATIGGPIHDAATLSGGQDPRGQITFTAYGPGDPSCSNDPAYRSDPVAVSGDGDYESRDFTPAQAGVYRWTVEYSGDPDNDAARSGCRGAHETSTIAKAIPSLTTTASPGIALGSEVADTANLAGGHSPGGKITFRLYRPGDTNCASPPVFTAQRWATSNGSYRSAAFRPTQTGTYRWRVSYSGDPDNKAVAEPCNAADESVTVTKARSGAPSRVVP